MPIVTTNVPTELRGLAQQAGAGIRVEREDALRNSALNRENAATPYPIVTSVRTSAGNSDSVSAGSSVGNEAVIGRSKSVAIVRNSRAEPRWNTPAARFRRRSRRADCSGSVAAIPSTFDIGLRTWTNDISDHRLVGSSA